MYVVFWIRDGKPVPIPRILGIDEGSILYIGTTRSKKGLRGRIGDLWISVQKARDCIKRKRYPHTFGPSLVYTGLHNLIRDEELYYFKEFSVDKAEYQEKRAILEYTRRYGEPPPAEPPSMEAVLHDAKSRSSRQIKTCRQIRS